MSTTPNGWTLTTSRSGLLIVLSAPSGGGKSTLAKAMRAADPRLGYSVSVTTRPRRPNEVDGRHYSFVSEGEFQRLINGGVFFEHARVHGHMYGTRRDTVEAAMAGGRDIMMDLDVQGGLDMKRQCPDAVLIFLLPPSLEVLRHRLETRATDAQEVIDRRLAVAPDEIAHWREYDYAVMNDDLDLAVARARGIVEAERHRPRRMEIQWGGDIPPAGERPA
jgi:guanylate kinase